jgi:diacylglycerol kinase (ATP)
MVHDFVSNAYCSDRDQMTEVPRKKTGPARIFAAALYSLEGLRSAFKGEAAFRQELLLFFVSLVVLIWLPVPAVYKYLIFCANCIVLITELLNSAIEAMANLVSPEFNPYVKKAKDYGSAAVFISLVLLLWGLTIRHLLLRYL